MDKCEFLWVYLRRTQEKLERVLEANKRALKRPIRLLTQDTYKWVKVDREAMWSAEDKSGIRWRNASRSGAKFSECRAFVRCNNYGQHTARGGHGTYRSACLQCRKAASESLGCQFVRSKFILSTARPQKLRVKRWKAWPLMSVDDVRVIIADAGSSIRTTRFRSLTSRYRWSRKSSMKQSEALN
jgi:hypothetical protein